MSLIMGPIGLEQLEFFALELGKIAAFDFVSSLASTNINQSTPNLVKMYEHKISDEVDYGSSHTRSVLSALEIEKLNFSSLFGIYKLT